MSRIEELMKTKKMVLIVSLPENSYEMAEAAWLAGADAIKVHINVFHRASQNNFGTLESEKKVFEKIIKNSPVPVGIVIGEETAVAETLVDDVKAMGFDFISLYAHYTPTVLATNRNGLGNFLAVNYTYSFEEINILSNSFVADILEMSIVQPEGYGERLNARDLAKYEYISKMSKIPTVVPTQRLVYPSDVESLAKCKINALMVGAISIGKTIDSLTGKVRDFKKAIEELS